MSSRYRHRRTPLPATPFPSPVEPGEIVVNTANRQLAVGDAAAGTLGQPKALIGVRFFDPTAQYALNDVVTQTGKLYRANGAIAPGAFNAANWTEIGAAGTAAGVASDPVGFVSATNVQAAIAELDSEYRAADAAMTSAYQAADTALQSNIDGKVAKAGDSMSGPLLLPAAAPTLDPHAANKKYVDDKVAAITSLTVADTPPAAAPDGALWWESDSGLLYLRYNDGNTSQWVMAAPQADLTLFATNQYVDAGDANALKYSAQSLTAPQQQQARQNIYAAPFDALAYSGMQINGAMEVSQERGATAFVISSGPAVYVVDGWYMSIASASGVQVTAQQAGPWGSGFAKYLSLSATAAQASIAATELVVLQHNIEGWRIARLAWGTANAQPVTIGFWTGHHRTGTYSLVLRNANGSRCYPVTYTQNVADAAEYKTVTIPGCTDGTWASDNTTGLQLLFTLACGSTYIATSNNSWLTTNTLAALGQINAVAATSDVFRITGVVVLPGNEAPSAARSPFVMRPYDQELVTCQRYYEKSYNYSVLPGSNAGGAGIRGGQVIATGANNIMPVVQFSVRKRAAPTISFWSGTGVANQFSSDAGGVNSFASVIIIGSPGEVGFAAQNSGTAANGVYFHYAADARL
jgi:hypothetical protein